MKSTITYLVGLLCIMLVPFAFADETSELAAFSYPAGAQMRMLDLTKAGEGNIAAGEKVIERIKQNNPALDTTTLEAKLASIKSLKEEIALVKPTNNKTVDIEQYLMLRDELRNLTAQFRDEARTLLPSGKQNDVRNEARKAANESVKDLNNRVKEYKNRYNAFRMTEVLSSVNITDNELLAKIASGTATYGDIRSSLAKISRNISKEDRKAAADALRESKTKRNLEVRKNIDEVRAQKMQGRSDRLQTRSERLSDMSDRAFEKNRTRLGENLLNRSERLENKSEMLGERADLLEERANRFGGRADRFDDDLKGKGPRPPKPMIGEIESENEGDEQ